MYPMSGYTTSMSFKNAVLQYTYTAMVRKTCTCALLEDKKYGISKSQIGLEAKRSRWIQTSVMHATSTATDFDHVRGLFLFG